jgi:hypothetical protein
METALDKTEMKTLADCMNALKSKGFGENFMVKENMLHALNSDKKYPAEEVKILNFYRFEGESDPGDNAILYAIETNDGLRGLLSDAYGSYADADVSEFIDQVTEISKRVNREGKE